MRLPKIGMGTFGSDKYDEKTVSAAVEEAIKLGYRLFDCAAVYGNEKEIGAVLQRAFANGETTRKDVTVMAKVWNDSHKRGEIFKSCKKTLADLRLDYLDVYFVHWPFPNYHAKGCGKDSRSSDSRPFFADEFVTVWREMEQLKESGLVREIAMSNMTIAKFDEVLPLCRIKPFAHEAELHPTFQQTALRRYCEERGIVNIGFCPLGSPNRPQRDRTDGDVADTRVEEIVEIAKNHNCSTAEICIAWAVSNGIVPIPFSSKRENLIKNLEAAEIKLTDGEMRTLKQLDSDNRLVKGQVFLWEGSEDWRDLWDEDGSVAKWEKSDGKWIKK